MPPQVSDDDISNSSSDESAAVPIKEENIMPARQTEGLKAVEEPEDTLMVESEDRDEDNEDEDGEPGPDEYVIEKIISHLVDEETGQLLFEIKWEGYEKKSDRTWEPEENLETASKILNEYLASKGGKDAIMEDFAEKKERKTKKRARASTDADTPNGSAPKKGRGRKSGANATAPDGAPKEFRPPTGSWEDEVVGIDACEGTDNKVIVYLTWKGGYKTQHPLEQVYKRCPQKMLKFYESHLVFKKNED